MYIIIFSLQFKSRLSASIHFYPYLLFIQSRMSVYPKDKWVAR
jgi:hypothetical protein